MSRLSQFKFLAFTVLGLIGLCSFAVMGFKTDQKRYGRVRTAYQEKESSMLGLLKEKNLSTDGLLLYIRAFKEEDEIELWAKNGGEKYKLLKTYKVCAKSGKIGPKRQQGDLQVPEGFYHINRFNPSSRFYLSLGINYPNKSDKILGKGNLGGDIFIHGNCVTIGCFPITDTEIKELYIFCVEAKNAGQKTIPVTIFPARLSSAKLTWLERIYGKESENVKLWKELKLGYDYFNETKKLPSIGFLSTGRHEVKK